MAWRGGQYTVTGTATNITAALSLGEKLHCKNIDVKSLAGNSVNPVYLGPSTVTAVPANARVQLSAGQAWSSGPNDGSPINTDEVFIIGTAGSDIVVISLVV